MDKPEQDNSAPFDTALLKRRRATGLLGPDFLQQLAAEELLARLTEARRRLGALAESHRLHIAACAPSLLVQPLLRALPEAGIVQAHWLAADETTKHTAQTPQVVLDHEHLPFADNSLDMALVLFDFACVNDLPRALRQWRRVLRPGGVLLAAMPGGATLTELRHAWAVAEQMMAQQRADADAAPGWRVAPFLEVRQLAQLAAMAGFAGVVTDVERLRVRHADALALMRMLKQTGWSNPLRQRPRRPVTRHLLGLAAAQYELHHADDDGRLPATFELLYLSAAKPTPGQTTTAACPA